MTRLLFTFADNTLSLHLDDTTSQPEIDPITPIPILSVIYIQNRHKTAAAIPFGFQPKKYRFQPPRTNNFLVIYSLLQYNSNWKIYTDEVIEIDEAITYY